MSRTVVYLALSPLLVAGFALWVLKLVVLTVPCLVILSVAESRREDDVAENVIDLLMWPL